MSVPTGSLTEVGAQTISLEDVGDLAAQE